MDTITFEKLDDGTRVITVQGKNMHGDTYMRQEIIKESAVYNALKNSVMIEQIRDIMDDELWDELSSNDLQKLHRAFDVAKKRLDAGPTETMNRLEKKIRWVVEIQDGVWIADWDGDPGRTLKEENAKRFFLKSDAEKALTEARKYRPFKNAKIY